MKVILDILLEIDMSDRGAGRTALLGFVRSGAERMGGQHISHKLKLGSFAQAIFDSLYGTLDY